MSPITPHKPGSRIGFPRVSGDEPDVLPMTEVPAQFSPRERG